MLAAVMLVCLSACGAEKTDEKPLSETLSIKLENVWTTYLEAENARQETLMWAYGYVIAYCDVPCRDNFVRAVAATSAAAETLEKLHLGECILTDEDYAEMLSCGSDLSYISSDYSAFDENVRVSAISCRAMALDLMTESFWEYGCEYMKRNAEVKMQVAEAQINIDANKTNEIMLLTGRTAYTDELYEKAPAIIKKDTPFIKDFSAVDEKSDTFLEEYERVTGQFSELESIQNANIAVFEDAVNTGDYSEIFDSAIIWDELYAVINLPDAGLEKTFATYLDESGTECAINPGDDLSKTDPVISLQFSGVEKTAFEEYMYSIPMNSKNYRIAGSIKGDSDCYISYNDGVICFDALWKSGVLTVTVYDKVSVLCPYWYAYYKLTEN